MRKFRHILIGLQFVLSAPMVLNGQSYFKNSTYKTDSVWNFGSSKNAMQLVNEANSLAMSYPVMSMRLATAALEKSISTNDAAAQYQAYNTLGTLFFNVGNFGQAASYFQLASDGFQKLNDAKSKSYADKYLLASNERLESIKKIKTEVKVTSKSVSKKKAGKYSGYKESDLLKNANSSDIKQPDKIDIYQELGNVYLEKKDTGRALEWMNKAGSYALNADNQTILIQSEQLGSAYNQSGNYEANLSFQNSVLNEGIKRGAPEVISKAAYNIGSTYLAAENPGEAIPFLKQSIQVAEKSGNTEQKQASILELVKAYENTGQYEKALQVIKNYVHTMDSLRDLNQQNAELNLALNAEFLKQEKRIQSLIATQKSKESDIRKQRFILWGLLGILILFCGLIYALFRNIRQKQKANMQIRLQSLRSQMNPHFIFNSLNSVNNFISKNDERSANKYLSEFSKLMRTVLKNSDQDFVSLETEIQTLKIYLELEYFRFGEKFSYSLEVSDDIDPSQLEIPPMLIQPYIENSIWHGLRYKEEKGHLEVRFFKEADQLLCTVKDNGIGRKKSAELKTNNQKNYQSTGIKNTRERIDLLNKMYHTRLQISISDLQQNNTPTGTMVRISLPYQESIPA